MRSFIGSFMRLTYMCVHLGTRARARSWKCFREQDMQDLSSLTRDAHCIESAES